MRRLLVTFFYTGLSPVAPGTVGSIAATAVLYILLIYAPGLRWQLVLGGGLLLSCVLTVGLGKWAVRHYHRKDPQVFVLDEVAGICLTNLFLPVLGGAHRAETLLIALVAFRIFDVTKPPPARLLEFAPGGWGILLDDLAAAVYANLLCQLVIRLFL